MPDRPDHSTTSRSAEQEIASGQSSATPVAMIVSVIVVLGVLFAVALALVALSYALA